MVTTLTASVARKDDQDSLLEVYPQGSDQVGKKKGRRRDCILTDLRYVMYLPLNFIPGMIILRQYMVQLITNGLQLWEP